MKYQHKHVLLVIVASLFSTSANAMPSYLPTGAQANVALSTITNGGWTQCYGATMSQPIGNNAESVLNVCAGDYLMMAGRETGSNTILSLAAALFSDAITVTGANSNTHVANGSQWWYNPNWSWGFTQLGDTVTNNSCDTSNSSLSMCLHTVDFTGGYRINNITRLNGSTAYEKLFFVANGAQNNNVPEPGSIALLASGLLGFGASRRKKNQA